MYRAIFSASIVFLTLLDMSAAITCYRCTVSPTTQTCRQFSESDEFTVDCPFSTMCLKKVYRLRLNDGTEQETVSRDCAKQKRTEEVYNDIKGNWTQVHTIEEPYEEGCITQKTDGVRDMTYCHCRGSYCNSSTKESPSYHTDAMAVIFVFNAMKYLRNID